jgi:hypothetical protein
MRLLLSISKTTCIPLCEIEKTVVIAHRGRAAAPGRTAKQPLFGKIKDPLDFSG